MPLPFAQSSFPEIYERELVGPLFRPWADLLVREVGLTAGNRVLDIACGTGIVARLARDLVGHASTIVGVDLNPGMLAVARAVAPEIDWRQGDAGDLPLEPGEQFDRVLCHQGLQFFPDKETGVREMRRATAAGGRVGVSTWASDETLPVLRELRRIAERRVGPISDRRHSYGDAAALEQLLRRAGFADVRSKLMSQVIHFEEGSVFARLNALALVGMSEGGSSLTDQERGSLVDSITRDSADLLERHTDASGFSYRIDATLATGRA